MVPNQQLVDQFLSFLAVERGLSSNTIAAYRRDLNLFLDFSHSINLDVGEIGEAELNSFLALLRSSKKSESSVARNIVTIRNFYAFLGSENGFRSPATNVLPPKIPMRLPKALSINEVANLIERCHGNSELEILRNRAILEVLYSTGARISELVALNLNDLGKAQERENAFLKLKGKGGKERYVPLGRYCLEALDQYVIRVRPKYNSNNIAALFLSARGSRLTRQSVWKIVSESARTSGLDSEVSPHSLRHSFATHLLDGGADVRVVQELLGHASVTTTQIYTLVTIDKLREGYAASHPRAQ